MCNILLKAPESDNHFLLLIVLVKVLREKVNGTKYLGSFG